MKKITASTTIIIFLLATLISCQVTHHETIARNKNTTTTSRTISENFYQIETHNGVKVHLRHAEDYSISVVAEENLQEYIKTEINNGKLKIYSSKSFKSTSSIHIYVTSPKIVTIESHSGSTINSENTLFGSSIMLISHSGSTINVSVKTTSLSSASNSGSSIKISGSTNSYSCNTHSGSRTNASTLKSNNVNVATNSGSNAKVFCSEQLNANTNSGSHLTYYGNPTHTTINNSSGGSINKG